MTLPPRFRLVDGVELPCICGRKVQIGQMIPGNAGIAMHEKPQCADFEKRECLEYVTWLRQQYQRRPRA